MKSTQTRTRGHSLLISPDVSETDDVMPAWLDFAFRWPHAAMWTGLCLGA
jgi:hypothetical protein